jgi:trans-aconitate 2-methyltransferase
MAPAHTGPRWDPSRYLRFADHRTRPGIELITRVPDIDARTVVDLGCGTGHLTGALAERFPDARVIGVDSSNDMLAAAAFDHPGIEWVHTDISDWEPDAPVDLLFSNAALHWLDHHEELFPRLRRRTAEGGVVAIQMPANWGEPTHRVPAAILDDGTWPTAAVDALMRDRLASPADYRRWLQPAHVDLWETTYHQVLTGTDPVWVWVTGSVLRPVLEALDVDERDRFSDRCRSAYRAAYPDQGDGTTLVPFRRLFMVATT